MTNQTPIDTCEVDVRRRTMGNFLRAKRQQSGISQKELAAGFGYTTSQFVSNWERGKSLPPIDTLIAVVKLCEIKPKELLKAFDELERGMAELRRQELIEALEGVG